MASVRASIMKQARTAASGLALGADAGDCPAIDQLLRCAMLSEDAAHTLEWAADTLRARGGDRGDQLACQLLTAARARLDMQPATTLPGRSAPPARSLAGM